MRRLLFASLLCSAPVAAQAPPPPAAADPYSQMEVLTRAMELIRQNYVDESKVGYDRLVTAALRGMLAELDPHSQYIAPETLKEIQAPAQAEADGAGFTLAPRAGGLVVVTVREDGPAAGAGLMPGDQVLKIGDAHAATLTYLDAVQRLRGQPGEPLRLTIWRTATQETKEVECVRQTESRETVRDAMLLDPALAGTAKIGYVRLLQFGADTATELADALDRLEEKGLTALVVDLRNNPGGLLTGTVEVCGEFLPPNTAIVTTEGRDAAKNPPPMKTAARQRRARTYPIALLINHASASGSELMAGALQDLKRAVLVGTTTFGKGSVQSIIPGDGGTAIRLTTAHYFTPSHKPIHGKGITPDIMAPLTAAEEAAVMDYLRTAPAEPDPIRFAKVPDRQLERAVMALQGVLAWKK